MLAKNGTPPSESDNLPDFEREVYINFILEDLRKEQENMQGMKNK